MIETNHHESFIVWEELKHKKSITVYNLGVTQR